MAEIASCIASASESTCATAAPWASMSRCISPMKRVVVSSERVTAAASAASVSAMTVRAVSTIEESTRPHARISRSVSLRSDSTREPTCRRPRAISARSR